MKKISRRLFSKQTALGLSGVLLSPAQILNSLTNPNQNKPNILFICSDQHSYKYNGFMGHKIVRTPNLDELSKNGVVFSNTYSGQPVCVPGRACLMTGMYASDSGSYCNSTVWDGSYPIWGSYLQDNGYFTRAYGKLDLDDTKDTGFDEIKTNHPHKHNPDITSLFRNPLCYRMKERPGVMGKARHGYHKTDFDITNEAVNFIQKESHEIAKPWVLYLGYYQPHPPFEAKEEYFNFYKNEGVNLPDVKLKELENLHLVYQHLRHFKRISTPIEKEKMRNARIAYFGMITELDMLIGKVITALNKSDQIDNTYIIYTSDHGETLGEHGLWYKNNLFENSVRVPFIISGPGIPNNKRIDTPISHIDLVPTILDISNSSKPEYLRGRSLIPLIINNKRNEDEVVYSESHSEGNCTGSFMIRKGEWKYIYFTDYEGLLYNLKTDPEEKINLIDEKSLNNVVDDLKNELFKLVDTKKITYDAFRKQKKIRDTLLNNLKKDELIAKFQSRLGEGQAKILTEQLKEGIY